MPADFLELIDVIIYAFSAWRYVLSPSFRHHTHKRWRAEGVMSAGLDILSAVFGIGLTLLPLWFVISILRG